MDLTKVRQATRGCMALWGGVLVEHLVSGTPEDVRQDVRAALEVGKEEGGFILGASHSIAVGTRYENFLAMLDEFDHLCG
jgi:uroporphyrinogen-III decarboxylase